MLPSPALPLARLRNVDFLLECIGFPPDHDLDRLVRLARAGGERAPWRGPDGEHLRLPLGHGLELRADREGDGSPWSVHPYFQSERRLRVAVETVRALPDSRYDALVSGWANPPHATDGGREGAADPRRSREAYPVAAVLTDARRIPRGIARGHVLAVSLAGFALDLEHVGDGRGARPGAGGAFAGGGWIEPLGGADDPGGCVELSARVQGVQALVNPVTGAGVTAVELDTPGRPLVVFTSPWQLEREALPAPRAGSWMRGVFLLTGRIAGGLRSHAERLGSGFG
jgi:hypothetical protein